MEPERQTLLELRSRTFAATDTPGPAESDRPTDVQLPQQKTHECPDLGTCWCRLCLIAKSPPSSHPDLPQPPRDGNP